MARQSKNNAEWYQHANNLRNHRKVRALRNKFGQERGYAFWTLVLEWLTEHDGLEFENCDVEVEMLATELDISAAEIREMIDFCVKLEMLFITESNFIYSESLNEKLQPVFDKRHREKERSKSRQRRENGSFCGRNTTTGGQSAPQSPRIGLDKTIEDIRDINISFGEIWDLYGKKVGDRGKCKKHWETKLKDQDREAIKNHIPIYLKTLNPKDGRQFQLHFQTYLNQRRWETDEYSGDPIKEERPFVE